MKDVNRVILLGRLGVDPVLKKTQKGKSVCKMSLGVNRGYRTEDGQWNEKTDWHKIVVWGKQAENCHQYLKCGSSIYIEGRLQTQHWQDAKGENRKGIEVVADNIRFLSGKKSDPMPAAG